MLQHRTVLGLGVIGAFILAVGAPASDPAGTATRLLDEPAAVLEMLPELASGTHSIAGDTITLDCTDLPQHVTFGVYARDWVPYEVNGWQTAIGCRSYGGDCSPPYLGYVAAKCPGAGCNNLPYQFGTDRTRADYIFYRLSEYPACNNIALCADDPYAGFGPGWFKCLSAIEGSVPDTGARKFINYYSFEVPSGARGIYEVRLDPNPLYTQLAAPGGVQILPLALNPAYVSLEPGYCYYNIGPGTTECTDRDGCMCHADCDAMPGETEFVPGGLCPPSVAIVASDPPSDSVDARQPSDTDGTDPAGWRTVVLYFDGATAGMTADDFTITATGGEAPNIQEVAPDGTSVTLTLDRPIPTAAWTRITHNASGTGVCLGYLPGDVDGNRISTAADILQMITCLNSDALCMVWASDINRDGDLAPTDILRMIDLLNGAGAYDAWLDATLPPSPCHAP